MVYSPTLALRVPIPLVMTASGGRSTTTFNTTWSGPEFLIGTKRPLELQHAVRDAVNAYLSACRRPSDLGGAW